MIIQVKKSQVEVAGALKNVLITIEAEFETDIDFSYWDKEAKKDTISNLNLGRLECVYIQAKAEFPELDYLGLDSIGQNFVRPSQFEKDILQSVEVHGLINNALKDLVDRTLKGHETLNQFLKGGQNETRKITS